MPRHLNHLTLLDPPPPVEPAPPRRSRFGVGPLAASLLVGLAAALYLGTSCGGSGTPSSAGAALRGRPAKPESPSLTPPAVMRDAGTSLLRDLDVLALRLHRGRVSEAHWRGWLRQPARVRRGTP
jgi:hypothetical protein